MAAKAMNHTYLMRPTTAPLMMATVTMANMSWNMEKACSVMLR
jgi:hypothetical protein